MYIITYKIDHLIYFLFKFKMYFKMNQILINILLLLFNYIHKKYIKCDKIYKFTFKIDFKMYRILINILLLFNYIFILAHLIYFCS